MKFVDIVYFGWLNAPNGVSKFTSTLQENVKEFNKDKFSLFFYSLDNIRRRDFIDGEVNSNNSISNRIINFIFKRAKTSAVFGFFVAWRRYFFNGKRVVKHYLKLKRVPDIVYTNDMFTCYYLIKNRGKLGASKIVFVLHTDGNFFNMLYSYYPRIKSSIFNRYLLNVKKAILTNIDKIGFVSRYSQLNFLSSNPEFPSEKSFFIHNGILDTDKYITEYKSYDKDDSIVFTCVGSVSTRKGHDIIVDALIQLKQDFRKRVIVQFVGDGPLFADLQEKCKLFSISNVKFLGPRKDVDNYLLGTDFFLLMSRDEGLPISIIEAMRCGVPIISTKIAGIPELVENDFNGIVIEPDVNQLLNVFCDVLDMKYDIKKLGQNSRCKYLKEFTLNKMILSYSHLFEELY